MRYVLVALLVIVVATAATAATGGTDPLQVDPLGGDIIKLWEYSPQLVWIFIILAIVLLPISFVAVWGITTKAELALGGILLIVVNGLFVTKLFFGWLGFALLGLSFTLPSFIIFGAGMLHFFGLIDDGERYVEEEVEAEE